MVNVLDCNIVVSKFELLLRHYIPIRTNSRGKGTKPLIPSVRGEIVTQLFFYKNYFGIKYPIKVDMPLNRETKPNLSNEDVCPAK